MRGRVWLVAGPAGSGKTTLGKALAARLRAPILDLDTVTNRLLDALGDQLGGQRRWWDDELRPLVRAARYACLRDLARDQVAAGVDSLVLVAPFTAELAGGEEWQLLGEALAPRVPTVVWLDLSASARAVRIRARGEARDSAPGMPGTTAVPPRVEPVVPHLAVDGGLPTDQQLAAVLALARGHG